MHCRLSIFDPSGAPLARIQDPCFTHPCCPDACLCGNLLHATDSLIVPKLLSPLSVCMIQNWILHHPDAIVAHAVISVPTTPPRESALPPPPSAIILPAPS